MDDILKSIRRIIRSDQDEANKLDSSSEPAAPPERAAAPRPSAVVRKRPSADGHDSPARKSGNAAQPKARQRKPLVQDEMISEDDNLIEMKIHDQKRIRILEKKLQTVELEYEQKLQLHRQKMSEYRRQNQELGAAIEAYEAKMEVMSDSLKTAYDCLEKLRTKNKELKDEVLRMAHWEEETAILKTVQNEFISLYHPDQVSGDRFSKAVRHEVFSEFSQILQGVQSEFERRRA
jgi:chromosome segregation ATPase